MNKMRKYLLDQFIKDSFKKLNEIDRLPEPQDDRAKQQTPKQSEMDRDEELTDIIKQPSPPQVGKQASF